MFAYAARRITSLRSRSPAWSLAASTLFAAIVIVACRTLVRYISHDPAELDGFIFLAGLYWFYSVVGYVATRSKDRRQSRATRSQRTASRVSAPRGAAIGGGA